jgi:hypothetical protein
VQGDADMGDRDPFLSVKYLEHCEPGELIRAFFSQNGQWAIVGYVEDALKQRAQIVIVLSGDQGPWYVSPTDIAQQTALPCLSYGKKFGLLPAYTARCDPIGGDATNDRYLVAEAIGPIPRPTFLNLDTFKVTPGEPGGNRAVFKRWSIWMTLPSRPDRPSEVFEFGQA